MSASNQFPPISPRDAVLLGPPGSGKSTIAERMAQRVPIVIISTGSRLRQEVHMVSG